MQQMPEAPAPTKLDAISFDKFLRKQPLRSDAPLFDLRGVTLITPAVLVQLAAWSHALGKEGRQALILETDNESVRTYLLRSGFLRVVSDVAKIQPELAGLSSLRYEFMRGSNPMLIEVTRIESGRALPALLDQFVWVLRYRLKYPKYDAFDLATAVSEMCQNTFDHNSGTAGFVAMQVYGKGPKRFLEIGVSDYGVGLAATLRRNPKNGAVGSDLVAIQLATKLGTSEHDDPTRGTGLYHLLEITYKHAGAIQVKSGNAKVYYRMDRRQGYAFTVPAVPGVHVALSLPSKDRAA
jgi:anti-sigma regulatory factor (Ser/Thr protein kinase)